MGILFAFACDLWSSDCLSVSFASAILRILFVDSLATSRAIIDDITVRD